jgi:hypothetical protein
MAVVDAEQVSKHLVPQAALFLKDCEAVLRMKISDYFN